MLVQRQSAQRQRIGPAVRRLRRNQGLTLDALAEAAGISASHLSRLERSQTLPSFPVLAKIADALQMDVNEFVRLEQDVAKLDTELGSYLDLLALGRAERSEIMNLSIEARRVLVERFRSLAGSPLTPARIQETAARFGAEDLGKVARLIRESGMSGVGLFRALMRLDGLPGPRTLVIASPSLLLLTPGLSAISLLETYRVVFNGEAMDPAILTWWQGNDATNGAGEHKNHAESNQRDSWLSGPVRIILGSWVESPRSVRSLLPAEASIAILRDLRQQMEADGQLEVAITDQDLGSINLHLADEHAGLLEHLPSSGRSAQPRRVALWLDEPQPVQTFARMANQRWESLSEQDKDRGSVMARLDTGLESIAK